jgi:hypothetical protein
LEMANLTLLSLSLQKERDVCASRQGEVNPAWMLRCAVLCSAWQHEKRGCFATLMLCLA